MPEIGLTRNKSLTPYHLKVSVTKKMAYVRNYPKIYTQQNIKATLYFFNALQPEGRRSFSATLLRSRLWSRLTHCVFQSPLPNRYINFHYFVKNGFPDKRERNQLICQDFGHSWHTYLIPYKRPIKAFHFNCNLQNATAAALRISHGVDWTSPLLNDDSDSPR